MPRLQTHLLGYHLFPITKMTRRHYMLGFASFGVGYNVVKLWDRVRNGVRVGVGIGVSVRVRVWVRFRARVRAFSNANWGYLVKGKWRYFILVVGNKWRPIYYISSSKCGFPYIGETGRSLRVGFGEHRRSVDNHDNTKRVARHFTYGNHCIWDMKIRAVCSISGTNDSRKGVNHKKCVSSRLGTLHPSVINERLSFI